MSSPQRRTPRPSAEFIVRACNAHDDLLAACEETLEHIRDLRDAWMRGAIDERDNLGGTRSNRNVEVEGKLVAAIAKAQGKESTGAQT